MRASLGELFVGALAAIATLPACAPPATTECRLRPLPAVRFTRPPPFVLTEATRLELEAPALACLPEGDEGLVTARLVLSPPPPEPPPVRVAPSTTSSPSRVTVELAQVPPGRYQAQLFVEPTIALFSFELNVANDRRRVAPVPVRTRCSGLRLRSSMGAEVCESSFGVKWDLPDGGEDVVSGAFEALLSADVLWLTRATDAGVRLERRVERADGIFNLTHAVEVSRSPARFHASDANHRWRNGAFVTTFSDGGASVLETPQVNTSTRYRFIERGTPIELRDSEACALPTGTCWERDTLIKGTLGGLGREALWLTQLPVSDEVIGVSRPFGPGMAEVRGPGTAQLRVSFALERSERITGPGPLVYRSSLAPGQAFVERDDGLFELWPEPDGGTITSVSPQLVEVRLPDGSSLLYRR